MIEPYVQEMLKNENQLKAIIDRVTENKVVDIIKEAVKLDVKEVSLRSLIRCLKKNSGFLIVLNCCVTFDVRAQSHTQYAPLPSISVPCIWDTSKKPTIL